MNVLTAAIVVSISTGIWLIFVRSHDKFEPEPLRSLMMVMFFGGLASAVPAGTLNDFVLNLMGVEDIEEFTDPDRVTVFCFWVGLNEEFWKAAMTVFLIRKMKDFNEPVDGIIYSMTSALGFAAFENLFYVWEYGAGIILTRSLMSVPLHLTCAALWGYGLARVHFSPDRTRYLRRSWLWILAAALAHGAYNLSLMTGQFLVALVILLAMIFTTRALIKRLLSESPFRPADIT